MKISDIIEKFECPKSCPNIGTPVECIPDILDESCPRLELMPAETAESFMQEMEDYVMAP